MWVLMAMILFIGFFELLFTNLFGMVFDVWTYYVNKGVISTSTVNYSNTNLFISGNRGRRRRVPSSSPYSARTACPPCSWSRIHWATSRP
ncbi:hypothetical protein RAA17_09460 [Komagataeibacter rhaeticus]|nr:hypothetical protein [Komagataeibacter rhaeticus]